MDTMDDSENNAKISDSAYSNSCSNSQSRRSHSSKSTHSGSNSSGSSGYGGQPSTSGYSDNLGQPSEKWLKEKESKKKKTVQVELKAAEEKTEDGPQEQTPVFETSKEEAKDVNPTPPPPLVQTEMVPEDMELSSVERCDEMDESGLISTPLASSLVAVRQNAAQCPDSFSCVISMQDGVVMFTTSSIVTALGFPKDMWIGRSFIDFVHPRDRNTFASQITNGLAVPKKVNGTQEKAPVPVNHISTMVCRIRRYRGLTVGFGIKEKNVTFMPFLLKFFFKNINDEEGQIIYLVIQATPFFSAFKSSLEILDDAVPFVIRHSANGSLEYIDPESVPYLGFLPQDIVEQDALQFYHPGDLLYLRQVYETIVREGGVERTKPYRMMTQNGDYLKVETQWTSFINPWSKKLEFVTGKHYIIEGPINPDVFQPPDPNKTLKLSDEDMAKALAQREKITRIMNEVLTKPAEVAKQQMTKRCQDLATFMESLIEETPKMDDELRLDIHDPDNSYYERDSVMLGGISPHHDYTDSKSGAETPVSYNQLNYNETLQRFFDSHEPYNFEETDFAENENKIPLKDTASVARSKSASPMALASTDYDQMSSSESSGIILPKTYPCDYQPLRLTETLLNKHNTEMERDLIKMYRENRSSKGERERASNESRQKKKQHLARCNAAFQPTSLGLSDPPTQGLKRPSKQADEASAHKHRCQNRPHPATSNVPPPNSLGVGPSVWPQPQHNMPMPMPMQMQMQMQMPTPMPMTTPMPMSTPMPMQFPATTNPENPYHLMGMGMPQQVSFMAPIAIPGQPTVCYIPVPIQPIPNSSGNFQQPNTNMNGFQYQPQPLPYMMYGQTMYGSSFMYPVVDPRTAYMQPQPQPQPQPQQQPQPNPMTQNESFGLSSNNYQEACKLIVPVKTTKMNRTRGGVPLVQVMRRDGATNIAAGTSKRYLQMRDLGCRKKRQSSSSRTVEKTDEESSYSSFYSSFFKTESGSAEDSDAKKSWHKQTRADDAMSVQSSMDAHIYNPKHSRLNKKKEDPPWMEEGVCVTSELIYKYQVRSKNLEEVLSEDRKKLGTLEQPAMVNEQLGQLYLDLQLQGVAARLTLEEGITSSSSSGEETSSRSSKVRVRRRKREYSKLVMIYEEDAPLPPPDNVAGTSKS